MLCLQGQRTLVVLVLGRREETHRLHYSLRRRRVRRLHRRLTVLNLCIESRCVRRVTPGYRPLSTCVVFTGSEDPCCSCSWSTRGITSFALFPPTPECTSSSSPVGSSQPVRRELLRLSGDMCLVQPPDAILSLTTRYVNAVGRGSVFRSRRRTQVVLVLSQTHGGTPAALFLRRSDARAVVYKPTKPDLLRLQKKRRRRSCCPVFLCSSPSTRDVAFGMFSPHMTMGYCSSPIQQDDASMVMSA